MARITKDVTQTDIVTRDVVLVGLRPILFYRYPGDNKTKLDWFQKLYFLEDGETVCIPSLNIVSLLSAHNTNSAPKRLRDKRQYKDIANACLAFVTILDEFIPFRGANGAPIKFGKAVSQNGKTFDPKSGISLRRDVARLDKGIPNPKERPQLPLPWSLRFTLQIEPNREIQEQEIMNLLEDGGRVLGLGTFRGVFGKFKIASWGELGAAAAE